MSPDASLEEVLKAFREKLCIDPEDPWVGKRWYRRAIDQARQDKLTATARWKTSAAFWAPAPFDGRPVSPSGHTTFHFDRSVCTRAPNGTKVVCSSGFTRVVKGNAAGGHHTYVNDGAAGCEEEEHSAYVRGSADEMVPLDTSGPRPIYRGRTTHTFSNIHVSPEVGGGYWRWVHETSPVPGPDRMRVNPSRLRPEEWRGLADKWSAEPEIAQLLLEAADKAADGRSDGQERLVKRFITLPEGAGKRLLKDARRCEGWVKGKPAIKVTYGRGGKTQERLVAEFPSELPLHRQVFVAARFCQFMNELGYFFEAAIHEPDHDNDARNGHLHINYHDRAAVYDEANRQWQDIPQSRTGKRGRPKRSNVPCLREEGVSGLDLAGDLLRGFRQKFAELANFELIQSGHNPRYHPGTHEELGIDQEPAEHLGNDAAKLASAGAAVPGDLRNAARSCEGEWRRRLRRLDAERDQRRKTVTALERSLRLLAADDSRRAAFQGRLRQLEELEEALDRLSSDLAQARMYHDVASNRAARARRTGSRILKAIENGTASRADVRQREPIVRRVAEAECHTNEVEQIYSQARPAEERLRVLRAAFDTDTASLKLAMSQEAKLDEPVAGAPSTPALYPTPAHHPTIDETFAAIIKKLVILPGTPHRPSGRVMGVSDDEIAFLLENKDRTKALLNARLKYQPLEIGRLRDFRKAHPDAWAGMVASDAPPPEVPKAIATLFVRYREHWAELVGETPACVSVNPGRETFQGGQDQRLSPRDPALDDRAIRETQIAAALDYIERNGALRSWTGETWVVDVAQVPPQHRVVFEAPQLASRIQESLEEMSHRLQTQHAFSGGRGGTGDRRADPTG